MINAANQTGEPSPRAVSGIMISFISLPALSALPCPDSVAVNLGKRLKRAAFVALELEVPSRGCSSTSSLPLQLLSPTETLLAF